MDPERELNPYHGLVAFRRTSCTGRKVYGSDLRHHETIRLEVMTCEEKRDLAHVNRFGRKKLIQIELTPNAFAALLTTMNIGDGIPCTILHRTDMKLPGDYPQQHEDPACAYKTDIGEAARDALAALDALEQSIHESGLSGVKQRILLGKTRTVRSKLTDTMPFVVNQFLERMEDIVQDGKAAIEAFVVGVVQRTGLEVLRQRAPELSDASHTALPEGEPDAHPGD